MSDVSERRARTPATKLKSDVPRLSGRLDDQLCFALYAAANAMGRVNAPPLKAHGLTYVQYLVLLVLWENDDRSVGEIGRRLFLDSGTLTPVLRRLERASLLTRRRAADDEREVRIGLTERGRQLELKVAAVRSGVARRVGLSPGAFVELRENLQSLRARLVQPADT